jgi:TetR/AcrR family transcriptional regulator, transcriptional repressor of bet genes
MTGTTARSVAQHAGVSPGTLTHHFAGMDDLVGEALRIASENFTRALSVRVARMPSALARLRLIVRLVVPAKTAARLQWRLWFQFWSRAVFNPALAGLHAQRYEAWRGLLQEVITDGVRRKEFHKVDARAEASILSAFIDGICLQVALGDPTASPAAAYRQLDEIVRTRLQRIG